MTIIPTVLLTGAASGIGRGIAIDLVKQKKYKLALLDINKSGLEQTKSFCIEQDAAAKIKLFECDVTHIRATKSIIDEIAATFGPLAVVINDAGIIYKHLIDADIDQQQVKQSILVNLWAPIFICSHAVPHLKQTKLDHAELSCMSIINITSVLSTAIYTAPEMGVYCATKFGLRGFTFCLFAELKDAGIKVCNLMPAWTNTAMLENHNAVERKRGNLDQIVIGEQACQPSDVAQTVKFILNTSLTCVPREIMLSPLYNEYKKSELFLKSKELQQSKL